MHMTSATHLLNEDRPDFERILNEALRTDDANAALAKTGAHLTIEQLRTLALNARASIAACAATEYHQYLKIREQVRNAVFPARQPGPHPSARHSETHIEGIAGTVGESDGAGLIAIMAVLTPILAGIAALIFLLVGYTLGLMTPEPAIAEPLRTAGWIFTVLAAAGVLLGMVALLLTALRNPAADAAHARVQQSPQVAEARAIWHRALLERGIRPFLHQVLANAAAETTGGLPARNGRPAEAPPSRHPRLGYSRPGFSSPNPDDPSSPRRGPEFSRPEYTSPEFSSPDFDTGGETGSTAQT